MANDKKKTKEELAAEKAAKAELIAKIRNEQDEIAAQRKLFNVKSKATLFLKGTGFDIRLNCAKIVRYARLLGKDEAKVAELAGINFDLLVTPKERDLTAPSIDDEGNPTTVVIAAGRERREGTFAVLVRKFFEKNGLDIPEPFVIEGQRGRQKAEEITLDDIEAQAEELN